MQTLPYLFMSRQFSVATVLLLQHVSLNMTQYSDSSVTNQKKVQCAKKENRFPFLLLFTFCFFIISSYEPHIKQKNVSSEHYGQENVIVVKSGGGGGG